MPRKKAVKTEAVEKTTDMVPDGQEESVLSDPDEKDLEETGGEINGEEISQAETENPDSKGMASAEAESQEAGSENQSQFDTEAAQMTDDKDDGEEIPQTGSGTHEGEMYPAEDALDPNEKPGNQSQSDTGEAQAMHTADAMVNSIKNTAAQVPDKGIRRRRAKKSTVPIRLGSSPVLAIDGHLVAETEAEKARNDLLDLMESQKTGRILTGTIQGVERQESGQSRSVAVIYHGE